MTRKLQLTARQVTAIRKGAAKAGFVPEFRFGEIAVKLVPADREPPSPFDRTDAEAEEERTSWQMLTAGRPDLKGLENSVLERLVEAKGEPLSVYAVRGAGPRTVEQLMELGFLDVSYASRHPERIENIWATSAGLRFWNERERHRRRFPSL